MVGLASIGIGFIADLVSKYGEPLVSKGIEKITGIKIEDKVELTPEQRELIIGSELKLKQLDFESLKLEYEYALKNKELEFNQDIKKEENISLRWDSDNKSDSRFAKLLRPVLTAYLIIVVTILALVDGNIGSYSVKDVWVELFTILCLTAVNGYFVLRTYEKRTGTSVWKK